jgi:hypothetical protein
MKLLKNYGTTEIKHMFFVFNYLFVLIDDFNKWNK